MFQVKSLLQLSNKEVGLNGHCVYERLYLVKPENQRNVPTHCFFEKQGFTIHIVVFYEVSNDFWWHSAARQYSDILDHFTNTEGAYNRYVSVLHIVLFYYYLYAYNKSNTVII